MIELPTPYYQDDWVTIYHADCRLILPLLSKVDLVLTDPPYVNLKGGYNRAFPGVADSQPTSFAVGDLWKANFEWVSCLPKHFGAIVFCSYHGVVETADAFKTHRRVALLTWWKRNSAPTGKNVPRFRSEFAWCFATGPGIQWEGINDTVFDIPGISRGCFEGAEALNHPTQKPLSLMSAILGMIQSATSVLDPFMGSGTTLRAAKDLKRHAIGIEIEEKYCEIAAKRMAQEVLI